MFTLQHLALFFSLSVSIMSSIGGYLCLVFYFLTLSIITIDSRSIAEKDASDNLQRSIVALADYRHRFEHSTNFKKLRWTLEHRYNKAYCQFCDLVVPVVRFDFCVIVI